MPKWIQLIDCDSKLFNFRSYSWIQFLVILVQTSLQDYFSSIWKLTTIYDCWCSNKFCKQEKSWAICSWNHMAHDFYCEQKFVFTDFNENQLCQRGYIMIDNMNAVNWYTKINDRKGFFPDTSLVFIKPYCQIE